MKGFYTGDFKLFQNKLKAYSKILFTTWILSLFKPIVLLINIISNSTTSNLI